MYKLVRDLPMETYCEKDRHEETIIHAYRDREGIICISPELFDIIQEEIRFAIKRDNQSLFEFGD
jgi:hypothetical protein